MAFDCICIDFQNSKENLEIIKQRMPYARVLTFVNSYKEILKTFANDINTSHFWLITTLIDYSNFNFDYIPEQHQTHQIHVWHNEIQKEGDTILIPKKEFLEQSKNLKFLRDFKDINYHLYNLTYSYWPNKSFTFDNLIDQVRSQKELYTNYYYIDPINFIPSFWEDVKLYCLNENKLNLMIPRSKIKQELYEYSPILNIDSKSVSINFDIVFIHNNELQWEKNYESLLSVTKNIKNKIKIISNIIGRNQAYKTAAELSETEYFYAVFAKIKTDKNFAFNFVPDTLKSPRHYIFDCYNPAIDYTYGHQSILLYNKKLVLENAGNGLDFTLSQKHDHIKLLSGETIFYTDPVVCYRTAFREIVKLLFAKKNKPTVEGNYILSKWKEPQDIVNADKIKDAYEDAVLFVEKNNYDLTNLLQSYEWKFVDELYKKRYN